MKSENMYNNPFSHIYVEEGAAESEVAKRIMKRFSDAEIISIKHYKDVFNRRHQNIEKQHRCMNLILAGKEGKLIYDGSPVCQDFDEKWFYYTSLCMNCLFSCDYCYLKGLYPSGNMVIFCNMEDYFSDVEKILEKHPMYLCLSYDTDLMAIEEITGYVKAWNEFAIRHSNLTLEIRTKSGNSRIFDEIDPNPGTVFAWTLSPEKMIEKNEHKTGSLKSRLEAAAHAMNKGFPVRLCFDPMIYEKDWKEQYGDMLKKTDEILDYDRIRDVSVGSFRISESYLKVMRKQMPGDAILFYPYVCRDGFYQYEEKLRLEMENYLVNEIKSRIPEEKIFLWKQDFE